jgi:hypothetical protein
MLDTGVLQLWDIERMKEVLALPRIDQPDRMHLDFAVHSKRQTIFSFGLRRSAPGIAVPAIEEWSLDPLEFRRAYAAGPQTLARIAIDESRGWLLATTMDGHLEVLDLEREHSVAHIQVSPDLRPIGGLAYCEAKGWALCTDNSDGAILVDVVRGNVLRTLKREGDTVQSAAFLQGGNRVALGGRRGTIGIWDPISGDHLIDVESLDGWAAALSASPDGTALLVGTSSGTLRYIDCLSAAQRIEQRGRHANNKLASGDQSFEEAGQVAWAQIWWDPEVRLTSASLLIARMRENHPNPGFVAALWSSLAFLRGDSEAAMQHADAALAHDDLSVETRSFLRGMRGLILLRQGEMAPALQELQHVRWREFARILGRERSLRP